DSALTGFPAARAKPAGRAAEAPTRRSARSCVQSRLNEEMHADVGESEEESREEAASSEESGDEEEEEEEEDGGISDEDGEEGEDRVDGAECSGDEEGDDEDALFDAPKARGRAPKTKPARGARPVNGAPPRGDAEGASEGGGSDLTGMKVVELRAVLAARGLPTSGTKQVLLHRLSSGPPLASATGTAAAALEGKPGPARKRRRSEAEAEGGQQEEAGKGAANVKEKAPRRTGAASAARLPKRVAGEGAAGPVAGGSSGGSGGSAGAGGSGARSGVPGVARGGVRKQSAWTGGGKKPGKSSRGVTQGRDNFVKINLRGPGKRKFVGNPGGQRARRKGGAAARFGGGTRRGYFHGSSMKQKRGTVEVQAGAEADGELEDLVRSKSQGPRGKCFRCGQSGHWAQQCTLGQKEREQEAEDRRATLLAAVGGQVEAGASSLPPPAPSEVGRHHRGWGRAPAPPSAPLEIPEPPPMPAELAELCAAARAEPTREALTAVLQSVFGHDDFRPGQLETIQRVLRGESTLSILPTGAGKSLTYQLPALLLHGVTLVVSPLVALMEDQLGKLPPDLTGACLTSVQSRAETLTTLAAIEQGFIKVLFVAPERMQNAAFLTAITGAPGGVALACVDEAHCISDWSHNFRPAYYRLGRLLREGTIQARCLLGLTATATATTEIAVARALEVSACGVLRNAPLRSNLTLSVSQEANKEQALLKLLRTPRFKGMVSIIVYVTYQFQADQLAGALHQNGVSALSYHAGKRWEERARVQRLFCTGKTKVVVATVAFGMGLDKADVGAVINYSLPRGPEEYVQQIGRAGRNGDQAFCHMFLHAEDVVRMRSLAHADGADDAAVLKCLRVVFGSQPGVDPAAAPRTFQVMQIQQAEQDFDMKLAMIETVLSLLEDPTWMPAATWMPADTAEAGQGQSQSGGYLQTLAPPAFGTCDIAFHSSSPAAAAERSDVAAAVVRASRKPVRNGRHVCCMAALGAELKADSPNAVNAALQGLASTGEISYELRDKAVAFAVRRAPSDVAALARHLSEHMARTEQCQVAKLDAMHKAANRALYALPNRDPGVAELTEEGSNRVGKSQSEVLREQMEIFFAAAPEFELGGAGGYADAAPSTIASSTDTNGVSSKVEPEGRFLRSDVRALLRALGADKQKDLALTGRAVARILHGLSSPAFPEAAWRKSTFWGRHREEDFSLICRIASSELAALSVS
ncbi:hypothetical protein CYMTET_10857, partial [Cymbomonas tetramitiformis]